MKKTNFLIISLFLIQLFSFSNCEEHKHNQILKTDIYYCPMHPNYTSNAPGQCPICNMDLVKKEDTEKIEKEAVRYNSLRKIKFYRNPMNPEIISKTPAKDEMGMDYIPFYEDEKADTLKAIKIDKESQSIIGIKTDYVRKRDYTFNFTSYGNVAYDPELYNAIEEYKKNLKILRISHTSNFPDEKRIMEEIVDASFLKLRQMGLSKEEINNIENNDYSNLLISKDKMWGYVYIYDNYIPYIKQKMKVKVRSNAYPSKIFYGEVFSIDEIVSPKTRTLKVRVLIDNDKEYILKPEMYISCDIELRFIDKILIPSDSVIYNGDKIYVYVVDENNNFSRRFIKTGFSDMNFTEVLSGISVGEKIVISSGFLIDSETRIRGL